MAGGNNHALRTDHALHPVKDELASSSKSEEKGTAMKRICFNVPESLYDDLQEFAAERGDSMTGVFRWCLGTGKAVWDELKDDNSIGTFDDKGRMTKHFVFQK